MDFWTERKWSVLATIVFVVYVFVGLHISSDYGVSWDEPTSRMNGLINLKYVQDKVGYSIGAKELAEVPDLHDWMDRDYGVAFELPLAIAEQLLSVDGKQLWQLRHALTFMFSALGVLAMYGSASLVFGRRCYGFCAMVIMIFSPRMFGESFYNSKDIVFMAAVAIAIYTLFKLLKEGSLRWIGLHSIASSYAVDIRIMGIFLVAVTCLALLIEHEHERRFSSKLKAIAAYLLFTGFCIILFFPFLWANPVENFYFVFQKMAHFRWDNSLLFMGEQIRATEIPWYYVPVWIAVTVPPAFLGLAILGFFVFSAAWWRHGALALRRGDLLLLGAVAAILIGPVAAVIVLHSVLYDGWRQLYFIYPAIVLFAVGGVVAIFSRIERSSSVRLAVSGVLAGVIACNALWMVRAHPLQGIYFNIFAGSNIRSSFDYDYWGLANSGMLADILEREPVREIGIRAISQTPLDRALLTLSEDDARRVVMAQPDGRPEFLFNNYRRPIICGDECNLADYGVYSQKIVDGEVIASVYRMHDVARADTAMRVAPFYGRVPSDVAKDIHIEILDYVVKAGRGLDVRVKIENRSKENFSTLEKTGRNVQLSWRLIPEGGDAQEIGWDARKPLNLSLPAGRAAELTFEAPASPGRYVLEVTLVQELVFWFQEEGLVVPTAKVEI